MQLNATPVNLQYGYDDNTVLKGNCIFTSDSLTYSNNVLLASAKDIAINRDQVIVLTDNIRLSDCVVQPEAPKFNQYVSSSLLKASNGEYLYIAEPGNISGSNISTTNDIGKATVFNFTFPASANTVQIHYNIELNDGTFDTNYLVKAETSFQYISAGPVTSFDESSYTYYFVASGDSISFLSFDQKFFRTDSTTKRTYLTSLSASGPNEMVIGDQSIYKLTRNASNNSTRSVETFGQSDLIRYVSDSGSIEIETTSSDVPFNYLVTCAYKNLTGGNLDVNVNTLKNYYSPRFAQTAVLDEQLRTYDKLYTGLNQKDGHDNIYVGYSSSVSKLEFIKDKDNYFHYPYGIDTLPLSSSTLLEYGAHADSTPYRSDKIFKKVADYNKYTNWGNSSGAYYPDNGNIEKGVFFCSWLSAGSPNPVWVDRFFDPRKTNRYGISSTSVEALSSYITDSVNNYPDLIWDVPSNTRFDPGTLYYYHRIGDEDNIDIINSFAGLTYHITNWGPNLVNNVTSLTAGEIHSFTTSNSGSERAAYVPYYEIGSTYGEIFTEQSDFTGEGATLSFFAYRDDWTTTTGDQIVGNYFNGGIGVFNNNTILTPYFTVASYTSAGGAINTYTDELVKIHYNTYTTFASSGSDVLSGTNFITRGPYDSSYYVVDNYPGNHYLGTFDPDDLITNKVPLSSTSTFDSTLSGTIVSTPMSAAIIDVTFYIDHDTNINYIITKTRPFYNIVTYNKFTSDGSLLTSITSAYNNFVVDLSGNPIFYNSLDQAYNTNPTRILSGSSSCVNSSNVTFLLSGTKIVRDSTELVTISGPEHINCDHEDNIWIVYNNNYLGKFTSEGNIIWSKQINTSDNILNNNSNRVINFIASQSLNGTEYFGLLLDGKSQYIYKIDMNGNVVDKVFQPGLIPNGDSTGFDAQRKYVAPYINTPGVNAKVLTYDTTLESPVPLYSTLNISTSAFAPGWHHFSVTASQSNHIKFYVDGSIVATRNISTPASAMFYEVYNYKNNPRISIGATNFKNGTLNEWIDAPTSYLFNGRIADVRYYNIPLRANDIKSISKSYHKSKFNNINWNIPTGTRSYIEEIERFFLHRLPGSKSQYYNIKIKNSEINDPKVRSIIENNIRTAVANTSPAHTVLRNIIWD